MTFYHHPLSEVFFPLVFLSFLFAFYDDSSYQLEEEDFRGDRFTEHHIDLKGNNEMLSITRPDVIEAIHRAYFEAGCDMVETNTFGATVIAQADYEMEELAYEQNVASARIAKKVAEYLKS